jgi:hypothetical protein
MKPQWRRAAWIGFAALFSVGVQAQSASQLEQNFQITLAYFVCDKPTEVKCKCEREEEKKTCPKCEEWVKEERTFNAAIKLNKEAYSYETGPPRANQFVNDVAKQIYGQGLPKDNGHTVTFGELYKDPQKYGWTEVPADKPKTGSLAVWPSMGGVVVSDTSQTPQNPAASQTSQNDLGAVEVLYPSDKKDGQLNRADAKFLDTDAKPKYVIPPHAADMGPPNAQQ